MKVWYFGIYNSEYSRNKILISGLRQNGVEVVECVSREKGFSKYFDLVKKHKSLKNSYDVMVVGYPGFQAMLLAKLVTGRPIVFDAFVSIYDSMVMDRAQVGKLSLKAFYFWWLDKISLFLADVVLFDTRSHIDFVSKKFGIKKEKFRKIFVGADTEVFYPREKMHDEKFKVAFYGHYIPLQGIEYIVKSAKLLENNKDIIFEIIGDGQEKKKILSLADSLSVKNVAFIGNLPLSEIAERMSQSDVCLGIFGSTEKTQRVIPNKVYECVGLSKPVITSDTPAIRELFSEEEIFLVKSASSESLAEMILRVKFNVAYSKVVAKKGYEKLIYRASIKALGLELKNIISSLINK